MPSSIVQRQRARSLRSPRLAPVAVLTLVALTAGCGGGARETALSEELKNDLAASSAARPELANGSAGYQPMRFVSELEQVNGAAPVQRTREPRRVAARSADVQPDEQRSPAPEVAQEVQVAETPTEAPHHEAPEADVPRVPSVAPRPSALPVDVPAPQGTGSYGGIGTGRGDGGVGIGDVIGVVIRGGGVGPDHCPPRRRGRPRFPILP